MSDSSPVFSLKHLPAAGVLGVFVWSLVFAAPPALASGPEAEAEPPAIVDSAPAVAPAEARVLREFFGFITDAAVARGLWAEVGELVLGDDRFDTLARVAYGWRAFEFGAGTTLSDSGSFRDLDLWAKYVGWKLGPADVGAGIVTQVLHGTPDFAPFATASLPVGQWDLRSSLGYEITHDFFYDAACLRPIGEHVDFRAELSGSFSDSFDGHRVQLVPGADIHFVAGDWRIVARMSVGANLHPWTDVIAGLTFVVTQT